MYGRQVAMAAVGEYRMAADGTTSEGSAVVAALKAVRCRSRSGEGSHP